MMCFMVVSDIEKVNLRQEMGSVSERCTIFTLRKKRTVRPEGAVRKSGGKSISGGEQQV